MEYGSIFGHGAYLGPDFTADCLHRAALISNEINGGSSAQTVNEQTVADSKANRSELRQFHRGISLALLVLATSFF